MNDWDLIGGDPVPLTPATVLANAEQLQRIAADWQRERDGAVADLGDVVRFWRGSAGSAWTSTQQRIGADLWHPAQQLHRSADVLFRFGATIADLADQATGLRRKARSIQAELDRNGLLRLASPFAPDTPAARSARQLMRLREQADQLRLEYQAAHRRCVRELDEVALDGIVRAGLGIADRDLAVLTELAAAECDGAAGALLRTLPAGQLAGLFTDLTPAATAELVEGDPGLGNLNGIPLPVRAEANRRRAEADLSAAILAGDQTRVDLLHSLLQPGAELVLYEPDADHYGVLWGDPGADRVAVFVPGVGSAASVPGWVRSARALNQASGAAVLMWKGYDDPGDHGTADIATAAFTRRAEDGATRLTSFCQDGLQLGRDQQLTVVAHSYGSVLTGVALADDGLRPSRVVVAGSPGMTVDHRSELHLRADQFYAEHAAGDYVANNLAGFGSDPAEPDFGGTRLATNGPGLAPVAGHSAYFQSRTQAIRGIADAVNGRIGPSDLQPPTTAEHLAGLVSDALYPGHDLVDQATRNLPGPIPDAAHLTDVLDNNVTAVTRYVITDPAGALHRISPWLP